MLNSLLIILMVLLQVSVLMLYIYHRDNIEKEPIGLILIIFILGMLCVIFSGKIWNLIANAIPEIGEEVTNENKYVRFLVSYGEIGFIEETVKYIFLNIIIYRNKNYNYEYDGIVYSTAISLGFALLEGINYGIGSNIFTTIIRGVLTTPMHVVYGVFMGYYLSKSKKNISSRSLYYRYIGLFIPIIIHGTSDYLLSTLNQSNLLIYIIYSLVIYIMALKKINELSNLDKRL